MLRRGGFVSAVAELSKVPERNGQQENLGYCDVRRSGEAEDCLEDDGYCGECKQQEQTVEPEAGLPAFIAVQAMKQNDVQRAYYYGLDEVLGYHEEGEAQRGHEEQERFLIGIQYQLYND